MALVVGLFAAQPALAQSTAERDRLALEVSHLLFNAVDLKTVIMKVSQDNGALSEFSSIRPEWGDLFRDAVIEEMDHDLPAMERIMAGAFVKVFTVEELQVGVKILGDPAFKAAMAAGARGEAVPPSLKPSRELERLINSRAGTRFLEKVEHFDDMMESVKGDLMGELIPGVFRRFAEKAEAAEARRAAAAQ
jgi:hypothetical protein